MKVATQRILALTGAIPAAVVGVTCVGLLIRSAVEARTVAPRDEQRIILLQARAQTDAAGAGELATERQRQSDAQRQRSARNDTLSMIVIAAAAAFLACAKHLQALRGRAVMTRDRLLQLGLPTLPSPHAMPRDTDRSIGPCVRDTTAPDDIDLAVVDGIVARHGRGREAAIAILQAIQTHFRYLPDEALRRVCDLTEITPAQIAGTSTFYAQFRRSPVGKHVIRVCHGTACHVAGARRISDELRRMLQIPIDADTDPQRLFTLDEVACLGCCSLAPLATVDAHTIGRLAPSRVHTVLERVEQEQPA